MSNRTPFVTPAIRRPDIFRQAHERIIDLQHTLNANAPASDGEAISHEIDYLQRAIDAAPFEILPDGSVRAAGWTPRIIHCDAERRHGIAA